MRKQLQIAVSAALVLAFCATSMSVSAATKTKASTAPPHLKRGVTLTVWDFFGNEKTNAERAAMEASVKTWEAKTGIHVNFAGNPGSTNTKMCQAGPAGQGPDLIGVPHDQLSVMWACKTLAPVPTWAWPASLQKKYIKEAVLATTIAGKQYAMPWAVETTGIFYNKALIPASFFKTKPHTVLPWSKVIAKAKQLSGNDPAHPAIGWDIGNFYFDYAFISGSGGYVFKLTKKGFNWKDIGLATPGAVKGVQFLADFTTNGKYKLFPPSMNGDTASGLFESGKMAMYISGPWDEANFQRANIDFGFAPDPSVDGKHPSKPFSGVQVFAVNQYSKNKNEAFALLSYVTRQMQLREFKTSGRIPVLKSLLASRTVQSDPVARSIAAAALAAQPMPNIPEMNQVWTPAANAIVAVEKGQASASTAMKTAVAQIKADIAKAHGG